MSYSQGRHRLSGMLSKGGGDNKGLFTGTGAVWF